MSLSKSATHRLSLLAGSSLVAAGLSAAASLGVALAPATAWAQATCTAATAVSGNGTNTVTIAGGTNNPGITCNYAGEDATVSTLGSITVSSAGGVPADPLVNGVNLRATGTSDIDWTSTAGTVTGSTQTNGPVIDARTAAGDITLRTAIVTGSSATVTHGIYASSTGGGAIAITSTGSVSGSNATSGVAGVEAISTGGNGDVSVAFTGASNSSSISGRLYGIRAQASGTGALTIGTGLSSTGASAASTGGIAGIHATTGTGLLTINGAGAGGAGTGVLINAGGDVAFTGRGSGTQYGIDVANVAAGTTTTLNLAGTRDSLNGGVTGTTGSIAAIRAQGAGTLLVNIVGAQAAMNFNFNGMLAPVTVNVKAEAAWSPVPNVSTVIPAGNFSIDIESGGALIAGAHNSNGATLETPTILTFSDPTTSLRNAGFILIGPDDPSTGWVPRRHEAELRIVGLKEFRHSGSILLGVESAIQSQGVTDDDIQGVTFTTTDAWYDDMLVFQDGTWIGEGGKIIFDIDTNRTQTNCVRTAVTHDFGAADCVRIVNSTVEGVTYLSLNQSSAGDRGRLTQQMADEGIVLIETPGSTVTAENFALDPTLRGFNPLTGNLDKGLYQYALLFDEEASQFKLFSTLTGAAYQLPMAATAAHNMWRVSTGSWLNRQADLRGSLQEGLGGGIWLRVSGEQTDREISSVSTLGGLSFATDSNHQQDTYAVNGGLDLLSASDGNMGYVVGLTAGYAHADVEYEASTNTQAMDAWTGGVYGGLVVGNLFVDAVVNANNVIIDTDAPGFNFTPKGTVLSSRMISLGGQVEAGYRMLFPSGFFAEPLASVSYVRSKIDDLEILPDDPARPGLQVSYEDPSSFRAGVGARVGLDRDLGGLHTQFSFLARTWQDLEGQNTAVIHNLAFPDDEDIRVVDEFSDQFNEVAVGASVWAPGGIVSGFLNLGSKFGEDYEAKTGSVGVRVAW